MAEPGHNSGAVGLPPLLAEIAAATSVQAALRLVDAFGGTRVYVPHRPPAGSPLTKAVGMAVARAIAKLYGGEYIHVPLLSARKRAASIAETERLLAAGLSQEQVARRLGVYRSTIQRRAEKLNEAPAPLPLFDGQS